MSPFRHVHIEVTTRCNLHCPHCVEPDPSRSAGRRHEISVELFRQALAQLPAPTDISLHGYGEPTIHPRLPELISVATNAGHRAGFVSNGSLREPDYYERCFDAGACRVGISADSMDPAIAVALRPGTRFDLLSRNITHLSRYHPDAFSVRSVIGTANMDRYEATLFRLHALGVRAIALQPFEFWGGGDDLRMTNAQRDTFRARIQPLATILGVRVEWSNFSTTGIPCHCPSAAPCINVRGFATPCCRVLDERKASFGNVADFEPGRLWEATAYRSFLEGFRHAYPDFCHPCSLFKNDIDGRQALIAPALEMAAQST